VQGIFVGTTVASRGRGRKEKRPPTFIAVKKWRSKTEGENLAGNSSGGKPQGKVHCACEEVLSAGGKKGRGTRAIGMLSFPVTKRGERKRF